MSLAIFDLDNTLIGGDSDVLWGQFLVERQLVDPAWYQQKNHQYYLDYKNGTLDIQEYLLFALEPLSRFSMEALEKLHLEFIDEKIRPILLPKAYTLIDEHKSQGDELLIITATNSFITRPIATLLGIKNILASEAEIEDGRYTGRSSGTPCFQHGKITRLKKWLIGKPHAVAKASFYSDSINDLPLLLQVGKPFAVDPCAKLESYAQQHNIPIISLRN